MSAKLAGRSYIVTGASKGYGLAIAQALVAAGANVGMVARNEERLQQAAASLDAARVFTQAADVGRAEQLAAAFGAIKKHFGGLHGVVNNAGLGRPNRVEHLLHDEVFLQVHTNYLGTVFGCQAAIPLLRGADNPRIVNISSAEACHQDQMRQLSIYASSKAAVERFTRYLRHELQSDDIGVSCVRPGSALSTDFAADWEPERFIPAVREWREECGPYCDTGMRTEDVADTVLYCLSMPAGVAVELLEVCPNRRVAKPEI